MSEKEQRTQMVWEKILEYLDDVWYTCNS